MIKVTQYCPEKKTVYSSELISIPEKTLDVFDDITITFLNKVSRKLLVNRDFHRIPEIAALGFWLRRANVEAMHQENLHWLNSAHYSVNPIGKVFHVAPSNVDTIFLYSLCISLLMGNSNIVRVSSVLSSPTVDFIISCINETLSENEFAILNDYIKIITYGHEEAINKFLSANANCRVIWGGDSTVLHFKNIPAPVYSKDILFPNRVSYSIFKASAYNKLSSENKQTLAHDFFNDAYTFDQLGCSSPKIIFILGNEDEKDIFVKEFYTHLTAIAKNRYRTQAGLLSVQKYTYLIDDIISNTVIYVEHGDNTAYLVETKADTIELASCQGGYFYLKRLKEIGMLQSMVSETVQTLTCFGLEENEITGLNKSLYGKRIDRIVPVGQALSFHYIWDGMNLFEALSRKRYIMNSNNKNYAI
jgi:hypothetical protein